MAGNSSDKREKRRSGGLGRNLSIRDRVSGGVDRMIRRSSTLAREGGTTEYVHVSTEPSKEEVKALGDVHISEEHWKSSRKSWVRQAIKLKQVEEMETSPIPVLYLRTAILCQYMNDSLLVLYRTANSNGTQLCKLVEYEKENINVFTQNKVKKEDDLSDLFSDYFEFHNVIPIGGNITFNIVEKHGEVQRSVQVAQYTI